MLGSTEDTCSASPGWLLEVFYDFLRDWWTRLLWSILLLIGDAPVARLLSLEISGYYFYEPLCFQLDLSSNFCAS